MELSFNLIKKNLKKDFSSLSIKKNIALLGDSPTQFFAQALKAYGYEKDIEYTVYDADIDQIDQQILDSSSELYAHNPECIILFESVYILKTKFYKSYSKDRFAEEYIARIKNYYEAVASVNVKTKILLLNFPELNDSVFGNYANKTTDSFLYQLRKINFMLMSLAMENSNLFITDVSSLYASKGYEYATARNLYINNGLVYSLDFSVAIAKTITDQILAIHGKFNKCLILDLDNTTWGGIIGDDGIENIQIGELGIGKAFTELQKWAKQLKERGIILCICSKNTESIAKEPFEKHPDMELKLDDIAVFVANWENKVDNIKFIQQVLNIGFDSMVFLDDNPFERNMVRTAIPEMTVPELPEDPSLYLPYVESLNLFETASYSALDKDRTSQYQVEAQRNVLQKSFANEHEFLESLEMHSIVEPFNKFNIPRVAQLTQRSNQFNLRTVRYTDEDAKLISESKEFKTFTFTLNDKYGEYGLIAIVILKELDTKNVFIENWLMSCRVLKRGMENFTLNCLVNSYKNTNFEYLVGEYIQTPKNNLVKDHYEKLGFTLDTDGLWKLNINSYLEKENYILKK